MMEEAGASHQFEPCFLETQKAKVTEAKNTKAVANAI